MNSVQLKHQLVGLYLLYMGKHLYKFRKNLNIYKLRELESNFIEISNPKKTKFLIGCI